MLGLLDVRTIGIVSSLVCLTLAGVMVYVRYTRRVYPGFGAWTTATLLWTVGLLLIALRGLIPSWLPVLLGNGAMLLSLAIVFEGFVRFFDVRRPWDWLHYPLFAATMLGLLWFFLISPNTAARIMLFCTYSAVVLLHTAGMLLTRRPIQRDAVVILAATACALMGVYSEVRGALVLSAGAESFAQDDRGYLTLSLLMSTVISVLLVFAFLQLVQARVERELMEVRRALELRANTDRLTGAWNRHRFDSEVGREMDRANRYKQPLSLVLFDVDHFKVINDRYGHPAGDQVLAELTRLVNARIRRADALIRWGGEEFLVLAPMTGLDEAVELAEELCRAVAAHDFPTVGRVTLSAGVSEYRRLESLPEWIGRADRGLYQAKRDGRNRVVVT